MNTYAQNIITATQAIQPQLEQKIGGKLDQAVIFGSGLSQIIDIRAEDVVIAYSDLPGLHTPKITSHEGKLVIRKHDGKVTAFCLGRIHLYEGYTAQDVALLSYLLSALGAQRIIVTNAAGALNPNYRPGDVMVIDDHINLTGHNPVLGQDDTLGTRFTDMSRAYEPQLKSQAFRIGSDLQIPIRLGIYAGVLGPTLETSAERRMLRLLGADAVGMSTVIETIAANHSGMEVCGLSAISNMALGDEHQKIDTIEEVLENVALAATNMKKIIWKLLELPLTER